ncbi:CLUMA_CG004933, isoform A [Clunio marinus]|uniref:CLUMA_CG004933, isoform A n=1 Tax=Clunio marinus TaxID=568069 RepID=A0A1J1HTD0_9DIPT|nr:CLUMA_CG004933, isoform A [Clunio marinus]
MLNEDLNTDFYSLFIQSYDNSKKNKEKGKNSSESHDETILSPIVFEISPNASKFAAFSAIRSMVLERDCKFNSGYKAENKTKSHDQLVNTKSEDEGNDFKIIDFSPPRMDRNVNNIPHIVYAGIQTLFEIISETKNQYPVVCSKALSSLFDIFQGHDPESFKSEPDILFQSLYNLLLDLATSNGASPQKSSENHNEKKNWSAISCSVLLALCIARGDTGKTIKAITSILMSSNTILCQSIKLPEILIKLQKSVECVALGHPEKPTYFEHGIPQNGLIDEFFVKNIIPEPFSSSALASDGKFLYILLGKSLYKVGSGYSGTTKGLIYRVNKDFTKDKRGWIGFCGDKLYYKKLSKKTIDNFIVVDHESLILQSPLQMSMKSPSLKKDPTNYILYSDGDSINAISAVKDDYFTIKEIISKNERNSDMMLNLAKRSFRTFGYAAFEEEILNNSQLQKIQSSFNCFVPALPDESEISGIVAGKEFGLVMTSNNKVFYYGKGASLGLKSLIKSPSLKLSELTISKVSRIVQASLGHDGLHTLLLSDDGSVFFAGSIRRGEDGEISKRRLLKPTKPKRISRLDNNFIVHVASNNGTSAFVTKTGKLIMFGKDTNFCDSNGVVSQLQDSHIVRVEMGKAHVIALNSKGQIFSFGVNNKGQCGRTFTSRDKMVNEEYFNPKSGQQEQAESNHILCDPEEHETVDQHCKICKICLECTGYNKLCSASLKIPVKNRIPGRKCLCGYGNSGCIKCGACKACIVKQENNHSKDQNLESSDKFKEMKKDVKINVEELNYPNESERVAPLPPSKVSIPSSSPVVQISCGLHHTILMTLAGEVFTFGSNQYGQLGTGDLQPVQVPVLVKIPGIATQISAGSNHSVVLSSKGTVYTFGNYQKGQLGRLPTDFNGSFDQNLQTNGPSSSISNNPFPSFNDLTIDNTNLIMTQRQRFLWNCIPAPVSGIGPNYRKKACWISASGDQTFMKIDESLVNASSLAKISVAANSNTIIFISNNEGVPGCITISKPDGKCKTHLSNQFTFNNQFSEEHFADSLSSEMTSSFSTADRMLKESSDQLPSTSSSSPLSSYIGTCNIIFAIDPLYDVLWCFDVVNKKIMCFNIIASKVADNVKAIFKSDVTFPKKNLFNVTRVHACLNVLACFDTLASAQNSLNTCFESSKKKSLKTIVPEILKDNKETKKICRFEAFGGGWGYFGHSVEAIRFMCDTDISMEGIGLYGGRGEYTCKIKIFELGFDGGGLEKDGTMIFEIDDIPYYCPARTIHNVMFQRPLKICAGKWYLLWVKVSGPSSDCGSSGQNIVVGDDQVVFTFKSSKKSNNGTDINSGQIPSILYRIVTHNRKISDGSDNIENICKISKHFVNTISCENLENLVKLLNWSWSQFKMKVNEMVEKVSSSDELLLNRYVYFCQVSLRLLKKYINEIYPSDSFKLCEGEKSNFNRSYQQNEVSNVSSSRASHLPASSVSILSDSGSSHIPRRCHTESLQLAESIGNVRALLITILCDDLSASYENNTQTLMCQIMDECSNTFISCFNAFYPTSYLKWDCLCDLLSQMDMGVNWNFREILSRLLEIISRPIRLKTEGIFSNTKLDAMANDYLKKMSNYNLISNCCLLLSKVLAEIVYQSCTDDSDTTIISPYVLQSTGIRFKKCDFNKTWNTGHFASDAICFTVDRSGIVLAGCCVYYGSGSYEYQLELLHDTLDSKSQMQHKWETIESTSGTFDQENVHRNMVQLKFERPIPLRENICYAIRFCSKGSRTCSGDAGYPSVRGPCGTIFRFHPCDLSFNGTTPQRGQIPSLLYYSIPCSHQGNKMKNNNEIFARDIALEFASDIVHRSRDLLVMTRNALLYSLSSSSDKSSNSSTATQTFDSEHNITPIEEHFDVTWMANPSTIAAPSVKPNSFNPYYNSKEPSTSSKEKNINIATKDITKKIETFSRGLFETLKLDKKFEILPADCVEVDNASEITPHDILDDYGSSKRAKESIESNANGNNVRKAINAIPITRSDSDESFCDSDKINEMFTKQESSLFHTLLPLTLANISRLICNDPKVSIEILNLVKSILPHITLLNQMCNNGLSSLTTQHQMDKSHLDNYDFCTTSNHYAILESDHPYKGTSIYSFKVLFPSTVKWMSLEFDPQCGTAQPEDCLKILIPFKRDKVKNSNNESDEKKQVKINKSVFSNENFQQMSSSEQHIMIKKFNTESGWSTNAIIIPGNEVMFSLETASNYLADHKLNRYGFKCILIGYESIDASKTFNNSLINLESEVAYLGGMCSANLMRKDLVFSGKLTIVASEDWI